MWFIFERLTMELAKKFPITTYLNFLFCFSFIYLFIYLFGSLEYTSLPTSKTVRITKIVIQPQQADTIFFVLF